MLSYRKINRPYLSFLVVILLMSGCGPDTGSGTVDPIGTYEAIDLITGDGTTSVEVKLYVEGPGGTRIRLSNSDKLVATANGQSQPLIEKINFFNHASYVTSFNFDDPGTRITISLEGPSYTPALDSSIELPEYINFLEPQSGANYTRQDNIDVSWQPSGEVKITFQGTCENGQAVDFAKSYNSNSGSETYGANDLLNDIENPDPNATCTTEIELMRFTEGTVPGDLAGGNITAQRKVTIPITISP